MSSNPKTKGTHYVTTTLMCHFLPLHLRHFPHVLVFLLSFGISLTYSVLFVKTCVSGPSFTSIHFVSARLVRLIHFPICIALLPENPFARPLPVSYPPITLIFFDRPVSGSIPLPHFGVPVSIFLNFLGLVYWFVPVSLIPFCRCDYFDQFVRCINCNDYRSRSACHIPVIAVGSVGVITS